MRANVDAIFFPHRRPLNEARLRYYLLTAVLVTLIILAAIFVPTIEFAFQFTGSVAAVSLAFTLPGMIALSGRAGVEVSKRERQVAWFMVVLGVFVSITGIATTGYNTYMGW